MVDYPIRFGSVSKTEEGQEDWWLETEEGLETEMSVPEEFGGDDERPSPEDLFSASLQSCMLATFKTIAGRKELGYSMIRSEARVTLERGKGSRPLMKEAEINLKVEGVKDREKAEEVAEAAEKNCFIHNSVKTEVSTNFSFE